MTTEAADPPEARSAEADLRVSPLELFFDLVFVFTVTQLTDSLAHHLDGGGLARVLVMLAIIWWMYDAFIWLANAQPPATHRRRGLHLLGMASFLVVALTIPHAFDGSGWMFGWAYLVIVVLHTGMFAVSGVPPVAVTQMGVINGIGCGLVVVGGYLAGTAQLVLWVAAFALQFAVPYVVDLPMFRLRSEHFIERHGLVVIVAFGESVVAIGVGAGDAHLTVPLLCSALFTRALCGGLWWAYFGDDDSAVCTRFMAAQDDARRNLLAVRLYNVAHYFLLLGVLLMAVGAKSVVAHPADVIDTRQAAALAGGVA
ncbi:MAG: low temperature requirement protein A, partial [Streptomycetaceae bacterium]|nr:low temperature requirement protein A [Streptomycetaceae bacterium]